MRILAVSGYDDYGALNFENEHGGKSATMIMDNIDDFLSEEGNWNLRVYEIQGSFTPEDAKLIKSKFIDHDYKKHMTFFVEGENIGL